ncbi:MAG: hypothetical protein RLZZ511_3721 [Cyanobacteriota bacterium]|jgi:uncharacterized integral membrane protein
MNALANLAATTVLSLWMLTIALIAVQNAEPMSLALFGQRSVAIPFGLLLTLTTVTGMLGWSLLQLLFRRRRPRD